MVSLKLTPFIGDGNFVNVNFDIICCCQFKTNPVYRGRKLFSGIELLIDHVPCLKLTPFIGDGNSKLNDSKSTLLAFKTNPVYRGRKPYS